MISRVVLQIEDTYFGVELFSTKAPIACGGLVKLFPLCGWLQSAAWSGPVGFVTDVNLTDAPLENPAFWLEPGTITYHPTHHDLGIAFANTQNHEPKGPVPVSLVARVKDNVEALCEVGSSLQRDGAKKLRLYKGLSD